MIYCDSSFLLSLYVGDSGSEKASRLMEQATSRLVWTTWHGLEFNAAMEARVGRELNSRDEAERVYQALTIHRTSNTLFTDRILSWESVFVRGSQLARSFGADLLSRSLDIIHVAACLELGIENFWTLDDRQSGLAKEAGLIVNQAG